MKRFIVYNVQIFLTWLTYIMFKKPLSKDEIDLVEKYYNPTNREKRILGRIKKINKIKVYENN